MTQVASRMGRLTREGFGYSMPAGASSYQAPPYHYRDAHAITITYETDEDAVLDILPEGLELPIPATVRAQVSHARFSTFGSYLESFLAVECLWQGERRFYMPYVLVTGETALLAGREIWGEGKKLAHIELIQDDNLIRGVVERPKGTPLLTLSIRPERTLRPPANQRPCYVSLRIIPSPEENAPPAADLVETFAEDWEVHEVWSGSSTMTFGVPSELDPWHKLPVRRIKNAFYSRCDFTLPAGKIIKRY